MALERRRLKISGVVQGVGFRPFLFNLARKYSVDGWVRNDYAGVVLEIQGDKCALDDFVATVWSGHPVPAVIDNIVSEYLPTEPCMGFEIKMSREGVVSGSPIPDQGICPDCIAEIFDPRDRRYNYPLNSCILCGPRFTIMGSLPYDRNRTTMEVFPLCPACSREYNDPGNRRFHGQTIACPQCGPKFWFTRPDGTPSGKDPGDSARNILKKGGILAIKGIGGYHLACHAMDEAAVSRLRKLKGRDNRPFAVMFKDIATVRSYCHLSLEEEAVLKSPARPILLLKQYGEAFPASVNPGLTELGAFLPYTGIQFQLFEDDLTALVMTSGNRSGEPLTVDDEIALSNLGPMTEGFLKHDRKILWRCDDSVLRWQRGRCIGIRRSRGYVPAPLHLKRELLPLLACGAQQKNTFALTKAEQVYLSQHQGDLDELTAFNSYQESVEHWIKLLRCKPEFVIHDLHPDYQSTIYARGLGLPSVGVQHHLAHLAGVMALDGITDPIIGVIFDGSGFGVDGAVWGGEFFYGEGTSWKRFAHLAYYPLPGGEAAIHQPWRMCASYLSRYAPDLLEQWLYSHDLGYQWKLLQSAIDSKMNAPKTSSAGRFFDAAAALAGAIKTVSYEGEAAIWLEHQADKTAEGVYPFLIEPHPEGHIIDPAVTLAALGSEIGKMPTGVISMRFHRTMAEMIAAAVQIGFDLTGIRQVALSGGVFQNRLLLDLTWERLEKQGFKVYVPEIVPINDGGIALGQAWLGSMMLERGITDVFGGTR